MLEWLADLKDNIDRHGVRWGVFFTLYAVYRKERRNFKLDQRDEAMFHNQRIIMEALGVADQWHGPVRISNEEVRNLKKWYSSSRKAINRGYPLRRKKKMQNIDWKNINWVTLIPALFGALKLILQPFGIDLSHVTDTQVNDVANGVAALLTIIGVLLPHTKTGGASNGNGFNISGGPNK